MQWQPQGDAKAEIWKLYETQALSVVVYVQ